ncbi:hypothetical protein [Enterobacter sp. JBIWA005]|uniref:hypothetical protein n=1 Tax=Enterobacter sp. JBIWA005 TaxID=2831891 RepID=UPI001CC030F8|nr:hypothetical protein [Enterobacter sp. JBIWA005]
MFISPVAYAAIIDGRDLFVNFEFVMYSFVFFIKLFLTEFFQLINWRKNENERQAVTRIFSGGSHSEFRPRQ